MEEFDFCSRCQADVPLAICVSTLREVFNGVVVTYEGRLAYCSHCGAPIFSLSVQDDNLRNIWIAYENQAIHGRSITNYE